MDPELELRRAFDVPVAMQFTLSGTARLNPRAPDPVVDGVLGSTPPGTTVSSTDHLSGDFSSRASAAVDGDLTTAWTTPLQGVVGQRWSAHVDQGFHLASLPFDVVVDDQHSLPTKLGITVDGKTQVFDVPALTTQAQPGSVAHVVFTPDQPLVGHDLAVEIQAIEPRTAPDLYANQLVLPVALAEIGLTPTPVAPPSTRVALACRDDLMTIDGAPVSLRIAGDVGTAGDGRLPVSQCDGTPLALGKGTHVIRTAPGLTTGIDIDGLALVSPQFTAAPSATDAGVAASRVVRSDARSATIAGGGGPYWVRLDQSYNQGWVATANGRVRSQDLGTAHPLDAFASGWFVARGTAGRTTIQFSWPPQRSVDIALAASALGVIVCLGLMVLRRRRSGGVPRPSRLAVATDLCTVRRAPLVASAVVVVVGTAFGSPAIGAGLLVFAVCSAFGSRSRLLAVVVRGVPLVALGTAVLFVWAKQARYRYPHDALWPSYFNLAHALTFFGFLALAHLVWADRPEDLHEAKEETPQFGSNGLVARGRPSAIIDP